MQIFNQFHMFKISEIFKILLWNINNLKFVKKSKKYFFSKANPKIQFTVVQKLHRSVPILDVKLILQ